MKVCSNLKCSKKVFEGLDYCSEACARLHVESKKGQKLQGLQNKYSSFNPNEGTQNKNSLQVQSIRLMCTYPKKKSLKEYSCLLCWDICVTQRTAMESYIQPMAIRGILVRNSDGSYSLNPKYQ